MALNFAWIKQHKAIVAGIVLGALVIIYLASKRGGSSSGVAGVLESAQQGQLQMAQLNAQLSEQGHQTDAQLESVQIQANAQNQHDTDAAATQIALAGLQGHLYEDVLKAHQEEEAALLPSIEKIIGVNPKTLFGHTAEQQTLENELALLLTRGAAAGNLPPSYYPNSGGGTSFGVSIPGFGSFGIQGI